MTDSVYDLLNPVGKTSQQRFWDTFTGSQLKSWWTFKNFAGSGTGAIDDSLDGGYKITTAGNTNDSSGIFTNDIRQFDPAAHVYTQVVKMSATTSIIQIGGLTNDDTLPWNNRISFFVNTGTNSSFNLITTNGGTSSVVASSISLDTSWHKARTEGRASSAILHLDDTLESVSTSNLPTVKCQQYLRVQTLTTATRSTSIRYMEVYNT